jgi:hypothetical protein
MGNDRSRGTTTAEHLREPLGEEAVRFSVPLSSTTRDEPELTSRGLIGAPRLENAIRAYIEGKTFPKESVFRSR